MDLIEIGASFDIISPLASIFGGLVHGPGHQFNISADCGWSGRDIEKLLRSRGVKTWGGMVVAGDILLKVPKGQAAWATYLLESAGITVQGGMVEPSKSPREKGESWMDSISPF